jgi:hypothetical protein
MVFYFSGHGSRVDTPAGWMTQDGKIETICPYDQAPLKPAAKSEPGSRVGGIPDHELNVWLRNLAEKKGNNIVRISSYLFLLVLLALTVWCIIDRLQFSTLATGVVWGATKVPEPSAQLKHRPFSQRTLTRMHGAYAMIVMRKYNHLSAFHIHLCQATSFSPPVNHWRRRKRTT